MSSPVTKPLSSYSVRQWMTVGVLVSCHFFSGIIWSLQAPFFPAKAEQKGLSSTEYGIIFGIYEFVNFLTPFVSPVFQRFPPVTMFRICYLLLGITTILFGFLDKVEGHALFLIFSLVLRVLEAFGGSMAFISNCTFITALFPGSVAMIFGAVETGFAVGMAVGPAVGGFLYQAGGDSFGFTLPFLVLGFLICFGNLLTFLLIPSPKAGEEHKAPQGRAGFFSLFKVPAAVLYFFTILATALGGGFLTSTLEPHLRQFSLDPYQVGLVFLIYAGVYAITTPVWGFISDKIAHPEYVTLTGSGIAMLSYILIGPICFLPVEPSLLWSGLGLAGLGLGIAPIFVSTFALLLKEARKAGFAEGTASSGVAAAMWMSAMSLGATIGPSLGGFLLDEFGFRSGTSFMFGLFCFTMLLLIISICFLRPTSIPDPKVARTEKSISLTILNEPEVKCSEKA